jgi:aspartate/glutamate racemase
MHLCDDTIQRDNIAAGVGVIPKVNYYKFAQYAHNLEEAGVDVIMLACSTFNFSAELARPMINTPIAQIDRPMMELAVKTGKKIGLLATLSTTVPSSERLLKIAADEAGKEIEIKTVLCSEAFEEYLKGNFEKHNEILLKAIDDLSDEVDCIAMAQLSMSKLALYLTDTKVPVYNSGDTGFERVLQMLKD